MARLECNLDESEGKAAAKENGSNHGLAKGDMVAFSKAQLLASKRYCDQRDLLEAILADKPYTIREVDDTIRQFMRKGVD